MASFMNYALLLIILTLSLFVAEIISLPTSSNDTKVYIVYMGSKSEEYSLTSDHYVGILQQALGSSMAKESLVRSYKRSFNGFAARLTEQQIQMLNNMKEVVSIFPSRTLELQTTRSWDFMGLTKAMASKTKIQQSDLIIGVIDSGIWPESPSFNDDGFGPPPKKWKGVCHGGSNFTCNNKLIGARSIGYFSARDAVGHGTHTASTAAGRAVDHASFYGIAEGVARGGAASARIAAYKVCEKTSCQESDILAAFDDAIADGVDVVTISIGGNAAVAMYADSIAIGAFHAMKKGILTVQSAGNNGDDSGSVGSVAPWIFTVAASSMDRQIRTKTVLGNGKTLIGNSINSFKLKGESFPIAYGKTASKTCSDARAVTCETGCLDPNLVKGKIVVCNTTEDGTLEPIKAGAVGVLLQASTDDVSLPLPLPGAALNSHEFEELISYVHSTKSPTANILKSESMNDTSAPIVASFSSRGPNVVASDILKPDIAAPGLEILAGYSPVGQVTDGDKRSVNYSILTGTSMACPHVAGAAIYLKSLHPHWSPSALKSALITTARPMKPSTNNDTVFAYGSGHLDPVKAANPGLVYEANETEYLTFLCKMGYKQTQITQISGIKHFSCPIHKKSTSSLPKDLNYPTLSALISEIDKPFNIKFSRTVTNVGSANSTYTAKIEYSGKEINVTVNPNSISFKSLNEKRSYNVSVVGKGLSSAPSVVSASLVWSDGSHFVRSPIVVYSLSEN